MDLDLEEECLGEGVGWECVYVYCVDKQVDR